MDNYSLDFFLIFLFAAVQWRISRLILAAYPERWARYAIVLFDVFLGVSYAFTFSVVPARLHLPGRITMVLGAGSLAYLMTATSVLGIYYLLARCANISAPKSTLYGGGSSIPPATRSSLRPSW